jgi:hypothetical protein
MATYWCGMCRWQGDEPTLDHWEDRYTARRGEGEPIPHVALVCPQCGFTVRDFDTYFCATHGPRRQSLGEVRQEERDEVCLYVCTLCGRVAD